MGRTRRDFSRNQGHDVQDKADPVVVRVTVPIQREEHCVFANHEYVEEDLRLELAPEALNRVKEAIVTDIELASAQVRLGFGKSKERARERFLLAAALRVIRKLGRFLADAKDLQKVQQLVSDWLGPRQARRREEIEFDPAEVGEEIAKVLELGARLKPARYETRAGVLMVTFPAYVGKHEVMIAVGAAEPTLSVNDMPEYDGKTFLKGQLYRGVEEIPSPCLFV